MAEKLIPARAIEEKIESIRAERQDLQNKIEGIKHEVYELIQAEEFYESVLGMAFEPEPGGPAPPQPPKKLPPTDAVIDLVERAPGINRMDVINQLEHRIATDSEDERHLLRNTIYGLVRREKLIRTEEDELFLPGQGPGSLNGRVSPKNGGA